MNIESKYIKIYIPKSKENYTDLLQLVPEPEVKMTDVFQGASALTDGKVGLVIQPLAGQQDLFLQANGTWGVPHDTTYDPFTGATISSNGTSGLVPQPKKAQVELYLQANGSWTKPHDTIYDPVTHTSNGLMSTADKIKLDSISSSANNYILPKATSSTLGGVIIGDNINLNTTSGKISITSKNVCDALGYTPPRSDTVYTHPTYTSKSIGLYKIGNDAYGHINAVSKITKADITSLGIPGQDTKYTHSSYTTHNLGLYKIANDSEGHINNVTAVTKADITSLGIPGTDTIISGAVSVAANTTSAILVHTNKSGTSNVNSTSVIFKGTGATTVTATNNVVTINTSVATTYTHPSYSNYGSGFYKVTTENGHVVNATKVTKTDIINLIENTYLPLSGGTLTGPVNGQATYSAGIFNSTLVTGTWVKQTLLDAVYPVGSIYMSVNNVSPATFLGGTWVAIGGRFLIGQNATYSAGATGGAPTHKIIADELPKHTHACTIASAAGHNHSRGTMNITGEVWLESIGDRYTTTSGAFSHTVEGGGDDCNHKRSGVRVKFNAASGWSGATSIDGAHTHTVTVTSNTTSNTAISMLPPYLSVYMWKRTR